MTTNISDRLVELNIQIPKPVIPLGSYTPALISGNHIYVSGQLPLQNGSLIEVELTNSIFFSGLENCNCR